MFDRTVASLAIRSFHFVYSWSVVPRYPWRSFLVNLVDRLRTHLLGCHNHRAIYSPSDLSSLLLLLLPDDAWAFWGSGDARDRGKRWRSRVNCRPEGLRDRGRADREKFSPTLYTAPVGGYWWRWLLCRAGARALFVPRGRRAGSMLIRF